MCLSYRFRARSPFQRLASVDSYPDGTGYADGGWLACVGYETAMVLAAGEYVSCHPSRCNGDAQSSAGVTRARQTRAGLVMAAKCFFPTSSDIAVHAAAGEYVS